jgi:hypothetical protein
MGLLFNEHPKGRRPNGQVHANLDNCVVCNGPWFGGGARHTRQMVPRAHNRRIRCLRLTIRSRNPEEAYDFAHIRLDHNEDFSPEFGRNPMNVIQDQLSLGTTLADAKFNTWVAYNSGHHPVVMDDTPARVYGSITQQQYINAIDASYFESPYYTRYHCERLLYYHSQPINISLDEMTIDQPLLAWFNFSPSMNKLFHTRGTFWRKLLEAAPPNGL